MGTHSNRLLFLWVASAVLTSNALPSSHAGIKEPFIVKRGDCELTVGGNMKIEHYFEHNAYLLNKNIPDENEYFKHTTGITIDSAYGKEKYGHKAVELFTCLFHKGVWGKALEYADRDSGPIAPSNIKFNDKVEAIFGTHSHTSGKPLIWFKEAWLQFSLSAPISGYTTSPHTIRLGWFPFSLGRGIALGAFYGLNKELLGLYSYPEDKGAPGINLHGTIIKDRLDYNVYYSKFEERSKALEDTINLEKRHIVGSLPFRGINKDDELIAGRLQWSALKDCGGNLNLEPYVFFNAASDQKIEIPPDSKAYWGSYGLNLEYAYGNFECGGETAFNYGKQTVFNIDRNRAQVMNRNGSLVEEYSHIFDPSTMHNALVTPLSRKASTQPVQQADGTPIDIAHGATINTPFLNGASRFRPAYRNKYAGWMAVVDAAYTIERLDLKCSLAYGYASGDLAPNGSEVNKTYHGFIGLHENYAGKRVPSIFILDERLIKIPVSIDPHVFESQGSTAAEDTFFSDLQHVGFGATWAPKNCFLRDFSINPNLVAFWKAHKAHKVMIVPVDPVTAPSGIVLSPDFARSYMGTELNCVMSFNITRDLAMFANGAVFIPGGYFADVAGVPVGSDIFQDVVQDDRNDITEAALFRLSDDTAFHLNMGFEFKF